MGEHSSHEVTWTAGACRGGVASAVPMNPQQCSHLILNGTHQFHVEHAHLIRQVHVKSLTLTHAWTGVTEVILCESQLPLYHLHCLPYGCNHVTKTKYSRYMGCRLSQNPTFHKHMILDGYLEK